MPGIIPTSAGTYSADVTFTPTDTADYNTATTAVNVTVNAIDLSTATIGSIADQTYTGQAITPNPVVTLGSATLTEGTDYTASYLNNTNVGKATLTITGIGAYTGTESVTFNIVNPVTYSSYQLSAYREASYGTPPNGVASTAGCHAKFVFTFAGAVNVSDATALANSLSFGFTSPNSVGALSTDPTTYSYTASGNSLVIDVPIGNLPGGVFTLAANSATTTNGVLNGITAGGDPVVWTSLTSVAPTGFAVQTTAQTVGTATVPASTTIQVAHTANVQSMNHVIWLLIGSSILAGTGITQTTPAHEHTFYNYTPATASASVVSNAVTPLGTAGYTVTQNGAYFTITANTPIVGQVLDAKVYDDNFLQAIGQGYSAAVTGLSYPIIDAIADQTYNGTAITPNLSVNGTTYNTASTPPAVYSNNTGAGSALASVTLSGCTYSAPFVIKTADLSTATIGSIADQAYTGQAITPNPVVTLGSATLTEGTDYTASYLNNTNVGKATLTITGIGAYTGTESATFNIVKATPTITAQPTASAITQGQALSASILTGGTGSVAGTFAFTMPGIIPTSAGTYSADVTFTPTDTADYNTVAGKVDVTVNPGVLAVSGLSPATGLVAGGTTVTIAGSGFTGATAVTFGSTPATSFTVVDDDHITAVTPSTTVLSGSGGGYKTVDVTVTTPVGASPLSSADTYLYYTLTVTNDGHTKAYSLADIEAMTAFTGFGGLKPHSGTTGTSSSWTGVSLLTLLADTGGLQSDLASRPTARTGIPPTSPTPN